MRGLGDHLSVGERIAFYRERRGYTQPVLAGLVGHSTDWLSKIERGVRKPPRIDKLAELARVLRVPLGDLMGQPVLMEDGEKDMDDVPAVRDALMSPRRLSKLLFGRTAERQLPQPDQAQVDEPSAPVQAAVRSYGGAAVASAGSGAGLRRTQLGRLPGRRSWGCHRRPARSAQDCQGVGRPSE
ncbi:helix-turn-helix domain-containing protein [Streptomyces sp. NPDC086182]|uniref:helix-turn-helix domain-containing protein n=1 Tax=Streptomyces sp. NPDC086182 TaxID=3155058 RepID=UPI00342253D7